MPSPLKSYHWPEGALTVLTLGQNLRIADTERWASWPSVISPVPGDVGSVIVPPFKVVVSVR